MSQIWGQLHTVYDLLCLDFGLIAFILATVGIRSAGRHRFWLLALSLLSYQLALSAKETALVFPLLFAVAWLLTDKRLRDVSWAGVFLPQMLWFTFHKFVGPHRVTAHGGYALDLSFDRLSSNFEWYGRWATDFHWPGYSVSSNWGSLGLCALALGAIVYLTDHLGRRALLLGVIIVGAVYGTIAFAAPRNLYVLYCALPGLVLLIGGSVRILPARFQLFVLLPVALGIWSWDRQSGDKYRTPIHVAARPAQLAYEVLNQQRLSQHPRPVKVWAVCDPFPFDDRALSLLVSLESGHPNVRVGRAKFPNSELNAEGSRDGFRLEIPPGCEGGFATR